MRTLIITLLLCTIAFAAVDTTKNITVTITTPGLHPEPDVVQTHTFTPHPTLWHHYEDDDGNVWYYTSIPAPGGLVLTPPKPNIHGGVTHVAFVLGPTPGYPNGAQVWDVKDGTGQTVSSGTQALTSWTNP